MDCRSWSQQVSGAGSHAVSPEWVAAAGEDGAPLERGTMRVREATGRQ